MKQKELLINDKKIGKIYIANNFFLRLRGLMGRDPEEVGALLIKPCSQIHTFFMSDAIDVIYVDKKWNVIHIDVDVKPSRICRGVRGSKCVIEIPKKKSIELNIQVGDRVLVE